MYYVSIIFYTELNLAYSIKFKYKKAYFDDFQPVPVFCWFIQLLIHSREKPIQFSLVSVYSLKNNVSRTVVDLINVCRVKICFEFWLFVILQMTCSWLEWMIFFQAGPPFRSSKTRISSWNYIFFINCKIINNQEKKWENRTELSIIFTIILFKRYIGPK